MTPTRAQDIIRKIDGGLIEGKVISSSGESVQFSIQIDTTWERFSIPKDRVESIVYVDGGFEQFTNTYISGTSIDTSSQEADLPYLADKKQSDHVVDGIVVESDNAVETTPKNKTTARMAIGRFQFRFLFVGPATSILATGMVSSRYVGQLS